MTDKDVLAISQIAQWRNQQSELISAEFRYFFREYSPSPQFNKTPYSKNRYVQYFSTPPIIQAPSTVPFAYMARWDLSRPIVFYISANTPKRYLEAVKDGLRFWNHIFQKDIIEIRDLPEGKSAPDPTLNILQWVVWDNEPSAYADMVLDPLTGQILQAQIYVRSGWITQAPTKLRNTLEQLLLLEGPESKDKSQEEGEVLPQVFETEQTCVKTMNTFSQTVDLAQELAKDNISDETLLVLTGDILRAVIAHEMGHVLGLRHNLAGSTEGNMSLADRDYALRAYLHTGKSNLNAEAFLSRSIMDVFSAADDALVGSQIRGLLQSEAIQNSKLAYLYDYDRQSYRVWLQQHTHAR